MNFNLLYERKNLNIFFLSEKKNLVALINSKLVDFVKSIIVESTLLGIFNSDIQDSNLFSPL